MLWWCVGCGGLCDVVDADLHVLFLERSLTGFLACWDGRKGMMGLVFRGGIGFQNGMDRWHCLDIQPRTWLVYTGDGMA